MTSLAEILDGKRVVVCCGSGGVGKTTVAAAVALEGALAGKRSVVCTIDPARRLANSLGLEGLGNEPSLVPAEAYRTSGLEASGELRALMLDTKRTFDALIERYASTPEARDRILDNRMYQSVAGALAGSHEYMAMEKLLELSQDSTHELLVLDTPPTTQALDFLEAPKRVTDFVSSGALDKFFRPYVKMSRFGLKAMQRGMGKAFEALEQLTGMEVLREISDFFDAFESMFDGFQERAEQTYELLRSDQTVFLLVTAPRPDTLNEATFFHEKLVEYRMPFGAFVVNMVHPRLVLPPDDLRSLGQARLEVERGAIGTKGPGRDLFLGLERTFHDHHQLVVREKLYLEELAARLERQHLDLVEVPFFDEDIHDLAGLHRLGRTLLRT